MTSRAAVRIAIRRAAGINLSFCIAHGDTRSARRPPWASDVVRTTQQACANGRLRGAQSLAPSIKHEADGFRGVGSSQFQVSEPVRSVTDREQGSGQVT